MQRKKKKKTILFKNYTSGHTAAIHVEDKRCVSQFFKQHRLMPDGSSVPQVLTPCPSVLIRVSSLFSQFADYLVIGFTGLACHISLITQLLMSDSFSSEPVFLEMR